MRYSWRKAESLNESIEQLNCMYSMKKIIYLFVVILLMTACKKQKNDGFILKGTLGKGVKGELTIQRRNIDAQGKLIMDSIASAVITDGEFLLSGAIGCPSYCSLRLIIEREIEHKGEKKVIKVATGYGIALENQADTVELKFIDNKPIITGSDISTKVLYLHKHDEELTKLKNSLAESRAEFSAHRKKEVSQAEKEMHLKEFMEASTSYKQARKKQILKLLNSEIDLVEKALLFEIYKVSKEEEIKIIESLIQDLTNQFCENYYHVRFLNDLLEKGKKLVSTSVGHKFTDFEVSNLQGDNLFFSSEVGDGKYVLLEFWASWCGPCKKEIPTMKKAYDEFNSKGFEIFSVSVDKNEEAWRNISEKVLLPWINTLIIDEAGKGANELYAVSSIPTNFLIDPNGIIIAKNLRGAALGLKLSELLNSEQ